MIYRTISAFRSKAAELLKIRKGVYRGVTDEIKREFKGKTIDQIRQNHDMILLEQEMIVIKLRLPDKRQRLSKSNGYRLIYIVSKVNDVVVFLYIYPKNGPLQQLSITDAQLKGLLEIFIDEAMQGTLEEFQMD